MALSPPPIPADIVCSNARESSGPLATLGHKRLPRLRGNERPSRVQYFRLPFARPTFQAFWFPLDIPHSPG